MLTDIPDPTFEVLRIPISRDPKVTRNFITSFLDSPDAVAFRENADGAPGIFVYNSSQPLQGLHAFGFEGAAELEEMFRKDRGLQSSLLKDGDPNVSDDLVSDGKAFRDSDLRDGDLLVVQARPNTPHQGGSTSLGRLRLALNSAAIAAALRPAYPKRHEALWVTDFPLFTPDTTSTLASGEGQGGRAGFSSTHHPFTAPKTAADVDLLLTDPPSVKADHYDLVVNGIELGGGSRRIHRAEVQEFVMKDILKVSFFLYPRCSIAPFHSYGISRCKTWRRIMLDGLLKVVATLYS